MVATMGIGTALVTAPAAQAAPIGSVGITASVSDQIGVTSMGGTTAQGNAWNNCITYSPADTTTSYSQPGQNGSRYKATTFVGPGSEARTAHGAGNNCPAGDTVTITGNNAQSAVGIAPAVSQAVNDGEPFSLARVTHYNNPVNGQADFYTGNLKVKLSGFDNSPVLTFPWALWETANQSAGCPSGRWKGNGNCQDEIKFTSQISDTTLTKDGLQYKLVVNGFVPSAGTTCALTLGQVAPVNDFWTDEGANTNACIYASVTQIRNVTVNKTTAGAQAPGNQPFAFTSTATLDGSQWKNGAASVTPATVNTPVQVFQKQLLRSDKVTISETPVTDPRWKLSSMACTEIASNGSAQALAGASYANGVITLDKIGAPPNTAKPDITCTFTNTFSAGSLKIAKVLDDPDGGFSGPASTPYAGTYTCGGTFNGTFSIAAGSSKTIDGIPGGSKCDVVETPLPSGNLKNGSFQWGAPTYSPSGSAVIVNDAIQAVTITNHITQNKGTFTVKKVVRDAAGGTTGFQGGGARIFPVSYTCSLAGVASPAKTLNATTTGAVTSEPIPTGSTCTLTENLSYAQGDFGSDPSYEWVGTTGVFAPTSPITIGTAANPVNVTLTNTFTRNLGQLEIAKKVVDALGGYTGGDTMAFKGTYSCGGGAPVNFSVTTKASTIVDKTIPVGTSCVVTETAPTTGLLNSSFQWAAAQYAPASATVTIPKTGTGLVTITNTVVQNSGKFSVTKTVSGPAGDNGYTGPATREFTVHYKCTLANAPVLEGDLAVTTKDVKVSGNIPTGYSCLLTEPNLATQSGDFINDDTSYEWVAPGAGSFTPGSTITIGNNTTVAVALNNKYIRQLGSLKLAKVVSGAGYTGGTAENFTLRYNCGGSYTGTVKLAAGADKTITGLPANSICTVSEDAPVGNLDVAHKWGTPSWDVVGNKVTIAKNATVTATVTNATVAIFGTISVSKAIEGGGVKSGATFDLTVTCSNADYTKTFTLKAGESATTQNLPVGTSCTVSEGARPTDQFVDESYTWGAAPANQTATVATENQNVAVTITNTTVRVYGSLTVAKTLQDPDGVYAGAPNNGAAFTGQWSCTYGTDNSGNGNWSVAAGSSTKVASNILLGSRCAVTEDALTSKPSSDASYSWLPPVLSPTDGTVVLSAANPNGAVSVANAITRSTGLFTVAKNVVGPASGFPEGSQFPFTWACTGTDIGWNGASGSLNLTDKGLWDGLTQVIPAGAECTVTEGANPAPNTSYTWDGVALTAIGAAGTQADRSFTFKIPTAAAGKPPVPVNVTAANAISQKFATVNVAKTAGPGYDGALKFNITLDCGPAGSFTTSILGGASADLSVPLGSDCTVSEATPDGGLVDGSYAWDTAVFTPASFSVTQTQNPIKVAVNNPTKRVFGSFDVAKVLKGLGSVVDPERAYTGTWSCQYGTAAPVTGKFSVKAGATTAPIGGILVESTCSVQEDALSAPSTDPSYVWAAPVTSAPAIVAAAGTAHLRVTNEVKRNTGSILVTKQLSGATEGLLPGQTFNIVYSCSAAGVGGQMNGSKSVGVGTETLLLDNVPFGWDCVISEGAPTADQLKDASFSWGAVAITPAEVVLSTTNNPAKVTVTNNVVRNLGSVNLEKVFAGPTGVVDADKKYTGSFTCTYGGESVASGKWSTTAGAPSIELAKGLPLTTSCAASEDAPGAPSNDPSYTWAAPKSTLVSVVSGVPAVIEVTNTLVRNIGNLSVTKNVTGSNSELAGYTGGTAKNFTVAFKCTVPNHPEIAALLGSAAVANGGTETLGAGIPAGWECAIAESTPSAGLLQDSSFAWGDAIITPATVTVKAGTTSAVTVENPIARVYGSVDVRKVLVGPDGASAVAGDRGYAGTWSCTYGQESPVSGKWTAKAQLPAGEVNDKVLLNSNCTIAEDTLTVPVPGDASYQWVSQVGTPDSVAVGKSAHLVMTNTYVRDTASFTVTKKVDGAGFTGGADDMVFTVAYNCGTGFTGTLNLAKDGTATVTGIPSQRSCTVMETKPSGNLQAAYKWLEGTWSSNVVNGAFTVDKATPTAVVVTNHTEKTFGQISVAKALGGVGGVVQDKQFTFSVTCTDGYSGSITVGAEQTPKTTGNIAVGSQCTVTEVPVTGGLVDDSFGWGTPPEPATVTVAAENQVVPVTITNTTERRYGTLNVGKVLTDPDGVYQGGNFAGTWTCTYGQGDAAIVKSGDWSVEAGKPAKNVASSILLGSTCNVVENKLSDHPSADTSYLWAPSYSPGQDVVLTTGSPNGTVTVTNTVTRLTGSFAVAKTVAGAGAANGLLSNTTFDFSYKCTGTGWAGAGGTFSLKAGGGSWNPVQVIPAGASCTVTEGANPGTAGTSYTWDGVAFAVTGSATTAITDTDRSVTFTVPVPVDGKTQTVGISATNTITQKFGDVVVAKNLAGATQGYDGKKTFDITLNCENAAPQTLTLTAAAGTNSKTVSLPIGTKCSVAEGTVGTDGLKDSSFAWGSVDITNGSFTVSSSTTAIAVTVVNTIDRVTGSVDVTKKVTGPDDVVDPSRDYTGTWTCTYPGDAAKTGKWTVKKDGSTAPVTGILLNSVCTETEDVLTAPSVDPSYRWASPTLEGTTVTLAGTTAHMTVTNNLVRDTGTINVTKAVTGEVGGYVGGTQAVFDIGYVCKVDGVATPITGHLLVANGETAALPGNVPFGWTCTIGEVPAAGNLADGSFAWGNPVLSETSVVLSTDQRAVTIDVANPVKRVYGSLEVAKVVTGPAAGKVQADRAFTGNAVCSYGTDEPVTKTWTATTATPAVIDGVLVGSICAVTETVPTSGPVANDPSMTWLPAMLPADVTVTAAPAVAKATVENPTVQLFGDFSITKSVTGATRGVAADAKYRFNWSCISAGFTAPVGGTATVPDGGVWQLPAVISIPRGSICSVTEAPETRPGLVDAVYTWEPVVLTVAGADGTQLDSSTTFTIPNDGAAVLVTAENPIDRTYGEFAVTKTSNPASGSKVKAGQKITYTLSAVNTSKIPVHDVVLTDNLDSVLASTSLVGDATATVGTSAIDEGVLAWNLGTLAAGATQTLTYTVIVNAGSENNTITNVVLGSGDVPPTSCASAVPQKMSRSLEADTPGASAPCGTTHVVSPPPVDPPVVPKVDPTVLPTVDPSVPPTATPTAPLAETGAVGLWFLGLGGLLLAGGAVLLLMTRRRGERIL
jgi:uncharacterized repeat protein (TIGR01451 family)